MLRLASSSSVAARAICQQSIRIQHQRLLLAQRRALSTVKPENGNGNANTKPSTKDPKPPVLPGGASKDAPPQAPPPKAASAASPPPKSTTPVTPSSSVGTSPTQVPLTPPSPPKIQTSPPQASSTPSPPRGTTPPPPPPPPATAVPKKSHKFRNIIIGLTLALYGSFAAGVFYSLKSDNVHDFFCEYIPFGEEAVLYFEEREFRRRFPNALSRIQAKPESPKVTIPKSSGATWKLADRDEGPRTTDVGKPGPHISSHKAVEQQEERAAMAEGPKTTVPTEGVRAEATTVATKPVNAEQPKGPTLQPVALPNSVDPVVQDLAKAVNNIIDTVNRTNSGDTFGPAIDNAKAELEKLNAQISVLKAGMDKAIKDQLDSKDLEFAQAAQGLLKNVNNQVEDMQHQLREEFEAERERIAQAYQRKLSTELERSREIADQRVRNELLEQAIEMKRNWINEIENRVESERGGRLGKLRELEQRVHELEELTTQWNQVIETNLKTQQLFTALEAVRASFESPDQPKPFLREMAALKEVADDDEVIRAAIASVNPAAYQNGVATHTALLDKFRKLEGEVRRAALLPEDAGVAAHAGNWLLSKLMFKKRGLAQGNDVESILAKTETYLEEGDVDSAAREMNQLTGWPRKLAEDWLREARLMLEVKQALDVIAAEARVQSLRLDC
ncbi:mitochondrial inner membrane protein-domain-containing protein [Sphaerosporella brunnea]|uniref:MICOS complex subunit MIC60 n=1 Tax=Sphaerosporella brunnea TaxID=1250544 RepID=A0A5J5F7J5_9PEZI|nr:mitochondrial inner membrane protein-domain-containing protein [Sphaerosporella brunnea]